MLYGKYLERDEILRRTKEHGFPQPWLIELFVYCFELFRELLTISPSFVLKGGAAAQLYMPVDEQRASVDLDLITGLEPKEIDKVFEELGRSYDVSRYTPKMAVQDLPLTTYIVNVPSAVKEEQTQLKIDIMFEEVADYHIVDVPGTKLFALDTECELPCISRGSLIADKYLTLATASVGIPRTRLEQYPKQFYDLTKLTRGLGTADFDDFLTSFKAVAASELRFRGVEYGLGDVVAHIDDTLTEFAGMDVTPSGLKKSLLDLQSAYLSKTASRSVERWVMEGLRLRHFLQIASKALVENEDKNKTFERLVAFEKELCRIEKMDVMARAELKEELFAEARERMPVWKQLKGKSEVRLFLELKLLPTTL